MKFVEMKLMPQVLEVFQNVIYIARHIISAQCNWSFVAEQGDAIYHVFVVQFDKDTMSSFHHIDSYISKLFSCLVLYLM